MKKRTSQEEKSSPYYLVCGNNSPKFIEKAGPGKYIPSDFVLLPIKLGCSHLLTKDNKETMASSKEKFSVIQISLVT